MYSVGILKILHQIDVILLEVDHLKIAVAYALRASKVCQTLLVEFRPDVYSHLFGSKS